MCPLIVAVVDTDPALDAHPEREEAEAFHRAEYPRLVAGLDLIVGERAVAEELAQEALLRAFQRWERLRTLDAPGAWTWRVAINLATSHLRRRGLACRVRQVFDTPAAQLHQADVASRLAIRSALRALPLRERTAVVLRHLLDLDVAETARRMDCSDDAVRSLTKRGMARLRAEFEPDTPDTTHSPAKEISDA